MNSKCDAKWNLSDLLLLLNQFPVEVIKAKNGKHYYVKLTKKDGDIEPGSFCSEHGNERANIKPIYIRSIRNLLKYGGYI